MVIETMREYLETINKQLPAREGFKYRSIYEFLLRNGQEYPKVRKRMPTGVRRGRSKECFRNAFYLAMEREPYGWKYVEGMAFSVAIPMMHAWVVDDKGCVVDPTWKDGKDYFGVELPFHYVQKTVFKKKTFGVVDAYELRWPLLTGKDKYPIV